MKSGRAPSPSRGKEILSAASEVVNNPLPSPGPKLKPSLSPDHSRVYIGIPRKDRS